MAAMNLFERTLRALGIREGDVISGPWGKPTEPEKPTPVGKAEKLDMRDAFGPGAFEKDLKSAGNPKYGHMFMEKPSYASDVNNSRYSTDKASLQKLRSRGWNLEKYGSRKMFGVETAEDMRSFMVSPRIPMEELPSFFLVEFDDVTYVCYKGARTYIRFWMQVNRD